MSATKRTDPSARPGSDAGGPIVIIGMHRSGTSLLARMLEVCGVFMGADLQGDHESRLFQRLNDALFLRAYCTWSNPFGLHLALSDQATVRAWADPTRQRLCDEQGRYDPRLERQNDLETLSKRSLPWGWKDPRNTFTLPVWQEIFPALRAVHVMRHGIDAAWSLYQRDWAAFHREPEAYVPALSLVRDAHGLYHSRHGWTLEQALFLWEQYVEQARHHCRHLGGRALEVRLEDLLTTPRETLAGILNFCGVPATALPRGIETGVDSRRCLAYRRDSELRAFARRFRRVLAEHGYEA